MQYATHKISLGTTVRIALAALATLSGGCALFGGSGEVGHRAKGYAIEAPKKWKSIGGSDSDRAYKLPSDNVVSFNTTCRKQSPASNEVLVRQLLFGMRNVTYLKKEPFQAGGGEGLFSSVKATLDGTPFHLEIFVLSKSTCIFDFTLLSPREISENDHQEFLAFIKSFDYGKN